MPGQMNRMAPTDSQPSLITEYKVIRWFVILWIGCILIWDLVIPSGGRASFPGSQAVIITLLIIHAAIYWMILSPRMPPKLVIALLITQAVIFIGISLVALHMVVSLCLYLTLAGVVIISLNKIRHAIIAGISFLILGIPLYIFYSSYIGIGTVIWFFLPIALFLIIAVLVFTQQVNAKARTVKLLSELAESHRQLEAYSMQVEQLTLANERQRMARELHDTLAQGLAGIILQLEAADSHLGSGKQEKAQAIIRQAMARARATLAESRQVIDQLRKNVLPSQDQLPRVIQDEVNRFSSATGIPVELQLDPGIYLPGSQVDCIIRTVSEALLNIARHANASQVWVRLIASDSQLQIEIKDNGTGFDPSCVISQSGHYGLIGLRERARLLGGNLDVTSTVNQGTSISIYLPLENEVEHE